MSKLNRFLIRSDLTDSVILNIEPEGVSVPFASGKEIAVVDEFSSVPVAVTLDKASDGQTVLSIWPGDGVVRVEEDGVDVLGRETVSVRA